MKGKRDSGTIQRLWNLTAWGLAGLLYLDVLVFLVLALMGVGLLIVYALEIGVVAGVLLLVGLAVYLVGKRFGMGKLARRVLLGALIASGVMLALFCVAIVVLALYTVSYTAGL